MSGFALSAVAWGAQEWTAASWDGPLYAAAVGVEVLAPLLAVSGLGRWPAHPEHLPERLGLFTIIVLGEAVLGVVLGGVQAEARLAFAIGFSLPAGIWWFYFRVLDRAELRQRVGGGQILTYLHLPMTLAVVVMAAAVEVALAALSAADGQEGSEPGMAEAVRSMVLPIRAGVLHAGGIAGRTPGPGLTGHRCLDGQHPRR